MPIPNILYHTAFLVVLGFVLRVHIAEAKGLRVWNGLRNVPVYVMLEYWCDWMYGRPILGVLVVALLVFIGLLSIFLPVLF